MRYQYLGKSGLKVSEIGLGTMTFGWQADEETSHLMLNLYSEAGGNFIDTADAYSRGDAERIIGRWLKTKSRDEFVLATKVRQPTGKGPNDVGLSRKHILNAVEASLVRLGTDYIDIYQAHVWDERTPLEETLSTLDSLVGSGKVRYLGASNFTGWQLQKAIDVSRYEGWQRFACLQSQYNLLCRAIEWELLPVCKNEGLGFFAFSPLHEGWLTGKYRRGMPSPPPQTRAMSEDSDSSWGRLNTERTWQVLEELFAVAKEAGKIPGQTAIRWLMQRPGVTLPIVGARTLEQLQNNLGACNWSLTNDQMNRLNQVSQYSVSYPYDFIARYQVEPWR